MIKKKAASRTRLRQEGRRQGERSVQQRQKRLQERQRRVRQQVGQDQF